VNVKLKQICDLVDRWCGQQGVVYDIVCDEDDLQGLMLFKRDRGKVRELLRDLHPLVDESGIHVREHLARSGTILVFSLRALSEHELARIDNYILFGGGQVSRHFAHAIDRVFDGPPPAPASRPAEQPLRDRLMASARRLAEAQRKTPTRAFRRASAGSQFRNSVSPGNGDGQDRGNTTDGTSNSTTAPTQSANAPALGPKKGLGVSESFCGRLDDALLGVHGNLTELLEAVHRRWGILSELAPPGGAPGLQGMGAEHQPGDLFQRFAQALSTLGQQMNIGPLQQLLKQQGIQWKKSEDGQALIFYVVNAQTKAPQPIARVGSQTLAKPQEFQKQLASMLDFAKGQAPGTEQQKYEEAQEAQKQLRDIANQLAPQDPSKGGGQPAQPGLPSVQAPGLGMGEPAMSPGTAKPGPAPQPAARPTKTGGMK